MKRVLIAALAIACLGLATSNASAQAVVLVPHRGHYHIAPAYSPPVSIYNSGYRSYSSYSNGYYNSGYRSYGNSFYGNNYYSPRGYSNYGYSNYGYQHQHYHRGYYR